MLTGAQAYLALDNFFEPLVNNGWWKDPYNHYRKFYLLYSLFYKCAILTIESWKILEWQDLRNYKNELKVEKQRLIREIWSMKNGEYSEKRMVTFIVYVSHLVDEIMLDWQITEDRERLEYVPVKE